MMNDEIITDTVADEAESIAPSPTSAEEAESAVAQSGDPVAAVGDEPPSDEDGGESEAPDYARMVEEDLSALRAAFPELSTLTDISELKNPVRFGALRELGLSAEEAYLATGGRRRTPDNRAHLKSSVPRGAGGGTGTIPRSELEMARAIFGDMSDREIQNLYNKVTKGI